VQKDCTEKKPFGISRHGAKGLHHTEKAFGISTHECKRNAQKRQAFGISMKPKCIKSAWER
jgi:hypothetical protein